MTANDEAAVPAVVPAAAPSIVPVTVPSGTVALLFTDIAGSTERWEASEHSMEAALRRHDALIRSAAGSRRGHIFKALGDGFCIAFHTVPDALGAAYDAQLALIAQDFREVDGLAVRMVIHAGSAEWRDDDYFGRALNKAARLLAIGHGGQVLLSSAAADLVLDALPANITLNHLGAHRLKDLETAEHVFQLVAPELRMEFPPLRSLASHPNNLPVQLTSFVGRANEVDGLHLQLLKARLLTLVGTGGVGKTRLGLQVAAEVLDRFDDGVWLVDLSAIADPNLVAEETARVLDVPTNARDAIAASLIAALRQKRALLIFDSCEHVTSPVASLAETILRNCPDITILATSRQALEIAGEAVHRVGTLEVPPPEVTSLEGVRGYSAVQLFVERSVAASSSFALSDQNAATVAEICRRLDGIALALELAAPKIAVLSPRQLADRLNERFRLLARGSRTALPRQQTLRSLIDWSYDLLDERERSVFRRLSIFAGGWNLEAASEVCTGEGIDPWDVFELLSSLVAKSLVTAEPGDDDRRYRLLDSMREYGRERLVAAGEDEPVAERHARYYATLVEQLNPLIGAGDDVTWQRRAGVEIDNLRAALDWSSAHEARVGLELLANLELPHVIMTTEEALLRFEPAAKLVDQQGDVRTAARVLRHFVRLEWFGGRPVAERMVNAEHALATALRSGDRSEVAYALTQLATCFRDAGRLDEADARYAEAADASSKLSSRVRTYVLRNWAINDLERKDAERARDRFREVTRLEKPGSEGLGITLLNLAEAEFALGNLDAAHAAAKQAKSVLTALRHRASMGLLNCNLAAYAMAVDRVDDAARALGEALSVLREGGSAALMLVALEHHALLAAIVGEHETAATILGYSEARYASIGKAREGTERRGYERLTSLLTERFGHELAERLNAGAALSEEEVISLASELRKQLLQTTPAV